MTRMQCECYEYEWSIRIIRKQFVFAAILIHNMLSNIKQFFKSHFDKIFLFLIIFLLCLLSFGVGMLTQFYLQKSPLEIENPQQTDLKTDLK